MHSRIYIPSRPLLRLKSALQGPLKGPLKAIASVVFAGAGRVRRKEDALPIDALCRLWGEHEDILDQHPSTIIYVDEALDELTTACPDGRPPHWYTAVGTVGGALSQLREAGVRI